MSPRIWNWLAAHPDVLLAFAQMTVAYEQQEPCR